MKKTLDSEAICPTAYLTNQLRGFHLLIHAIGCKIKQIMQ